MGESVCSAEARRRMSPRLSGKTRPFYGLTAKPNLGVDLRDHIVPSISTESSSSSSITKIERLVGATGCSRRVSPRLLHRTKPSIPTSITTFNQEASNSPNHRRVSPRLLLGKHTPFSISIPTTSIQGISTGEKVLPASGRQSPRLTAKTPPTSRFSLNHCQDDGVLCGKVCNDISANQERIPIPAFNLVDHPPLPPMGYTYSSCIRLAQGLTLPTINTGCTCKGACIDPKTCACANLNGPDFPYLDDNGGRLIQPKDVVFECGPNCTCGPHCVNRTSQQGLRFRLEVFRTPHKGWAVRSRDSIPSGAPVCEYTGILSRTNDLDNVSGNDFIFHIDCLETLEGLDGRERRMGVVSMPTCPQMDKSDDSGTESEPEFCIDGCATGGVARFINHSCDPNLFVQCVLNAHHDIRLARVMLFAAQHIPPMEELTYDYGYALDSVIGSDGKIKVMPCYCGAKDCRKRLY